MRQPAIIAVDIDGTLLSPDGDVLPGTRAEFARARAAGATIVLASGRPVAGLRRLLERLKLSLEGVLLSGANGSVTVDPISGEVIARHAMPHDLVHRIIEFTAGHDVVAMLSDGDDLVVDRPDDPQVAIEADGNGLHVRAVEDLRALTAENVAVDKILLYAPAETLRPVAAAFVAEFGDQVETAFSTPFYFEATAAGVDKGAALEDLARLRGLDPADSVAFGDNHNDLPLLRRAGLGVAMGNAVPEVLAAADRVTAGNGDEGIALVLMDLFGDGDPAPPIRLPEGIEPLDALDLSEEGASDLAGHGGDEADDDPESTRGDSI